MRNVILLVVLCLGITGCKNAPPVKLQDGDIIFHTSVSSQSQAVQAATRSAYSHMGLIYRNGQKFYVFEAIQPVKMTPLQDWIKRGKDHHYVVKRLRNAKEVLSTKNIGKMKAEGAKYLGKSYDLYFEWSDERIYCSELVWKTYKNALNIEIGELQRMKEFDLSHPAVREKLKERYGGNIPLDEWVISPEEIFNSGLLITVVKK